ncbi:hypothetical protein ACA910_007226 [Epithemia clementina (nom. ined.)]
MPEADSTSFLSGLSSTNNNAVPSSLTAHHTYVAGEDAHRLRRTAERLGLERARNPMVNVRRAVAVVLADHTLEAARMHSVGALGEDEHVDPQGTLHMRTLTRRKRPRGGGGGAGAGGSMPQYGALEDLFQKTVLVEVESDEEIVEELVDAVEGGSLTAAIFGIIKGTVGPAILYLPRGFSMAGWAVAIVSMILATCSYLYSAVRLLQCWRNEKTKMERLDEIRAFLVPHSASSSSLTKLNGASADPHAPHPNMLSYPELARRAFGSGAVFVQFGIAAMQFGVCLTYFIFVPQNLVECTRALTGEHIDPAKFLILMVLVEIPLSWIRDIRRLTPTNILATFLIAFGLLSCLIIAVATTMKDPESNFVSRLTSLPPTNHNWFLFVGTSFFVFEGSITLLVPLQEVVFAPSDKERFPMVNVEVTSGIVVFYVFFAMTCWASFGDSVKTALTASLPNGTMATVVQFAYSLAVILTFPLQAFPALEVVFHSFSDHQSMSPLKRNTIASIIVILLGLVAYGSIDYLGNVVSLLGSLVGIPIALIFPPLMHNILSKDAGVQTKVANYLVASLGIVAMGAASYATITAWDQGAE